MKIILISLIFIMLLSSCFTKEDNSIENTAKQSENIENKELNNMSVDEVQNSINSKTWKLDLKEKIDYLEKTNSIEDKHKNVFFKSFIWEYKDALKLQKEVCVNNKNDENCKQQIIDFSILSISDSDSNAITDLKDLSIKLNWEKIKFANSFTWKLVYNFNHRLSINKKWYISYYKKIVAKNNYLDNNYDLNVVLEKYSLYKRINSSKRDTYKTKNFEFIISEKSFAYKNWNKVTWDIDVYFFDIEPKDISLFNLDMFSKNDYSNLWNHLVNKSTALIKAYKGNEELKIIKPIKVLSNLNNISRKIYLTNLNEIPKNTVLTQDLKKQFRVPFIWNLNSDSWVWISTELKILNSNWDIEFLLY